MSFVYYMTFCHMEFYLRGVSATSFSGSSSSRGRKGEDTGNEVKVFRIFYQLANFWKILDPNRNFQKNNYSRVHLTLQLCSLTKLLAFPRQPRERKGLQDLLAAS